MRVNILVEINFMQDFSEVECLRLCDHWSWTAQPLGYCPQALQTGALISGVLPLCRAATNVFYTLN